MGDGGGAMKGAPEARASGGGGGGWGYSPCKILKSRRSVKQFQHSPRDISTKKFNLNQV